MAVLWVFSRKTGLPVDWAVASRKAKLLNQDYLPRLSYQRSAVPLGVKKQFPKRKGKREKRGQR